MCIRDRRQITKTDALQEAKTAFDFLEDSTRDHGFLVSQLKVLHKIKSLQDLSLIHI